MKITLRSASVAAALAGCCLALVSCGTDHPEARGTGGPTGPAAGTATATPAPGVPALRAFRTYLRTEGPKADAAIASHVLGVRVHEAGSGARTRATVEVDYGVWDDERLDRTAEVFARWRRSVYGDHGHVRVLAPAKMDAERDW
ncbi:hypothetical protein SAMN05428944_0762 [Streptomyces sp. 1222.5]|uniref:hypothetical protein n=1 Tax=unclassified Streptomyces TaxID=2593676 RepID=UPI00089932A2|nr:MULTISPECIES: hypothetical protein [unclassified Streptomyces]PKW12001.1 hypothetical protein BX260_7332 [Streptomyces sp. 5112.2]SEB64927.1 hypothetical protein SAMN05428944_0762 [Streptomyces sp. 1222.5]